MPARVATTSVLAALTVFLWVGVGFAQQSQCCVSRLGVCHDDAFHERNRCLDDCFDARQAAEEECVRHPRPLCQFLIGPLYARCMLHCAAQQQRDLIVCLVRLKSCINGRECENSPTPTRTDTRTATPTVTPPVVVEVATPTPTETPPR
jgi:hypothetical protein